MYLRLCVPVAFHERLLKAYHDDIVLGHMGYKRAVTRIAKRFFLVWVGSGCRIIFKAVLLVKRGKEFRTNLQVFYSVLKWKGHFRK